MPTRRFEQIALTQLSLSGCAIVFGACVLIARAQAQYVPPPAPPPPLVFNPSSPYTVPQPSYIPITPTTPSTAPGYVVTSPTNERVPGYGRSLLPRDTGRKNAFAPPPDPLRHRSFGAGVLFLLLRAFRIWLRLRVAAGLGRLLVPNLALFVTEKLPHQKARTTSQPRQSNVLLLDDRAVQGFTSDLSSCSIKLHDFSKRVCAHHSGSLRK